MNYDYTIITISKKKEFSTESNTNCGKIVEKYVKKCIKSFINVILNIKLLFISFLKSVINRKYF